jgi:hypothetical protein
MPLLLLLLLLLLVRPEAHCQLEPGLHEQQR